MYNTITGLDRTEAYKLTKMLGDDITFEQKEMELQILTYKF